MVSKNFQQYGRTMQQQRPRIRGTIAPYKKPFKTQVGPTGSTFNQMMFNASQIPDNPGYMDFNNPTPPINKPVNTTYTAENTQQGSKKNKNKPKNKHNQQLQQQPQQQQHHQNQHYQPQQQLKRNNWNKNKIIHQQGGEAHRYNRGGVEHCFNTVPGNIGPNRGRCVPVVRPGPRGPIIPPPPRGFQPPILPQLPPIGRGPMPPPTNFIRRNGTLPIPPPMPPMIAPRMPRGVPIPMLYNEMGKIKKANPKKIKGKSTIKTLKNLANQYPLDKPWVTEEIRMEHDKKVDIENRLKGHKDDELFAQFKTQRDKFVALYGSAREEYLKNEAAAVKLKDTKNNQLNNKTIAKDGNKKEAIPNENTNVSHNNSN